MNDISLRIAEQIEALQLLQKQITQYENKQRDKLHAGQISNTAAFGQFLNEKRKSLGIDLRTLELQTNVSGSTLKRLFKDPSSVQFSTVLQVANTLGVLICKI